MMCKGGFDQDSSPLREWDGNGHPLQSDQSPLRAAAAYTQQRRRPAAPLTLYRRSDQGLVASIESTITQTL